MEKPGLGEGGGVGGRGGSGGGSGGNSGVLQTFIILGNIPVPCWLID